ncbi:PREDICTED: MLP-like protein 34 [Lupinus angustifolius]|uniref:MLP-like protein 34 n=1 Tax=Lupinus angustifolius TaxID=3871 RepID=UPI00092F4716|nr:PREDICTED: MLP-like protein 34 [Lupinus angustifolius]
MSLTGKITTEFEILSHAAKFFHIIAKQIHHVQNITDHVHHGKVHEGDWQTIGSVRDWTYVVGNSISILPMYNIIVHIWDKVVHWLTFSYSGIGLIYISCFIGNDNDDAIIKWIIDYEKLNREIAPPYGLLRYLYKITEDIDAHLLKS